MILTQFLLECFLLLPSTMRMPCKNRLNITILRSSHLFQSVFTLSGRISTAFLFLEKNIPATTEKVKAKTLEHLKEILRYRPFNKKRKEAINELVILQGTNIIFLFQDLRCGLSLSRLAGAGPACAGFLFSDGQKECKRMWAYCIN